jgi:hypothetical protein
MLPAPYYHEPTTTPAPSAPVPVVYVSAPVVWEYKQVAGERPPTDAELNDLGREGWELAGILVRDAQVIFYFKREAR